MEQQLAEMKLQEELKRQIAILVAEGEIEKAKVIDDLFEVNTEEASHSYPTTRHAELYTKCDPKNVGKIIRNQRWI